MLLKQCKYVYICNDGSIFFLTKPVLKGISRKISICELSFSNSAVWKKDKKKLPDNAIKLSNFRNKFNN